MLSFWWESFKGAFEFSRGIVEMLTFFGTIFIGLGGLKMIQKRCPKFIAAIQDVPGFKTETQRNVTTFVVLFFGYVTFVGPYIQYKNLSEAYSIATNSLVSISNKFAEVSTENSKLSEEKRVITSRLDAFAIASGLTNLATPERADAFFRDYDATKATLTNTINALVRSTNEIATLRKRIRNAHISYDFNGVKRTSTKSGTSINIEPASFEAVAFTNMVSLQTSSKWSELLDLSNSEISRNGDWLTPYLFRALARASLSRTNLSDAIKDCEYVMAESEGDDPIFHNKALELLTQFNQRK